MSAYYPGSKGVVKATLNSDNTYCVSIQTRGDFNFSLSGTFVATVTIQRSFDIFDENGQEIPDNLKTWHDLETYSEPYQDIGLQPPETVMVRAGIKTGQYTSGSAIVRISR